MLLWMPSVTFPEEKDVRNSITYGYNGELIGELNISAPSVVLPISGKVTFIKDIPNTPPAPSSGEISYGS